MTSKSYGQSLVSMGCMSMVLGSILWASLNLELDLKCLGLINVQKSSLEAQARGLIHTNQTLYNKAARKAELHILSFYSWNASPLGLP